MTFKIKCAGYNLVKNLCGPTVHLASLHSFGEHRAYYRIPKEGPLQDSLTRKLIHGYYAAISYVDDRIGRVLNALENLGLRDYTIVVLCDDDGWR